MNVGRGLLVISIIYFVLGFALLLCGRDYVLAQVLYVVTLLLFYIYTCRVAKRGRP